MQYPLGPLSFLNNQNPFAMWAQFGLLSTRSDENRDRELVELGISASYFLLFHGRVPNPTLDMYGKIKSIEGLIAPLNEAFTRTVLYDSVMSYINAKDTTQTKPDIFTERVKLKLPMCNDRETRTVFRSLVKTFPSLARLVTIPTRPPRTPVHYQVHPLEAMFPKAPRKKITLRSTPRVYSGITVEEMQGMFLARINCDNP